MWLGEPGPSLQPDGEEYHYGPDEIELPLHGERPEVLEGAGVGSRRFVGELRADELDVLEVQQRCSSPCDQRRVLGERQQSHKSGDPDDQHRWGHNPSGESREVANDIDAPAGGGFSKQHRGEVEPRYCQENVDPSGDTSPTEEV